MNNITKLKNDLLHKYSDITIKTFEYDNYYAIHINFYKIYITCITNINKNELKLAYNNCLMRIVYNISYELQKKVGAK